MEFKQQVINNLSGPAKVEQIRLAEQVGITGFLVSWKNTPVLDRRLAKLRQAAAAEGFKLGIMFEGRDFYGRPLPMSQVTSGFRYLASHYGSDPVFDIFGRPLVAWSGTWAFTRAQLASVTSLYGSRLTILATDREPAAYQAVAGLFRGDAYYWSSADPPPNRPSGSPITCRSRLTDGAPSSRPGPLSYSRQDMLAGWPGAANGSDPSIRSVGEPFRPASAASAGSVITRRVTVTGAPRRAAASRSSSSAACGQPATIRTVSSIGPPHSGARRRPVPAPMSGMSRRSPDM
jgi:hypothetical protein